MKKMIIGGLAAGAVALALAGRRGSPSVLKSPLYKQLRFAHDYYSTPLGRDSLHYEVSNGYNINIDCRVQMGMGAHPSN